MFIFVSHSPHNTYTTPADRQPSSPFPALAPSAIVPVVELLFPSISTQQSAPFSSDFVSVFPPSRGIHPSVILFTLASSPDSPSHSSLLIQQADTPSNALHPHDSSSLDNSDNLTTLTHSQESGVITSDTVSDHESNNKNNSINEQEDQGQNILVESALRRRRIPSTATQETNNDNSSSNNDTLNEDIEGRRRIESTTHHPSSSLSSLSPTGEQAPDMFKRQENHNGIPFHTQGLNDQDDKYSKTPIGVQSKTRFRFRLRHGVIALGMLALTYLVISPSSETDNSTLKSLKDRVQIGNRKPSDNTHDSNNNTPVNPSEANFALWEERKDKVKEAFLHSWNAYRRDAWGKDEYHPIAKYGSNMVKQGQGFTIVDSLDTILLMGLKDEFEEAKAWVRDELTFDQEGEVNLFETTIRVLGGLLSAYDQSGHDQVFLTKAVDLADRLMGAFKTTSGIPYASVHLKEGRGVPGHEGGISSTSEVSTLQLEFKYLSYLTGDDKYWRVAEDVILKMKDLESVDGLVPIFINPYDGQFYGSEIRLGSRGDSYYEYLIKQYLQTSKKEHVYKEMFDHAMTGVKKHLLGRSIPNNLLFVGEISKYSPQDLSPKMDHLVCFLGGTMALSSTEGKTLNKSTFPRSRFSKVEEEDFKIGEELTKACYEMYRQTETGLAPEIVYWVHKESQLSGRQEPEHFEGSDFIINNRDGHNWLRPETVESLFYMWRFTGDEKYREWGWKIFEAIEKYSKVQSGGYSSIHDIRRKDNIHFSDKMETFFLAETLKYLYLLFGSTEVFPLDKYVFNTEAHPFPVFDPPKSLLERPVVKAEPELESKASVVEDRKELHLEERPPGNHHEQDAVDEAMEELAAEDEDDEAEEEAAAAAVERETVAEIVSEEAADV